MARIQQLKAALSPLSLLHAGGCGRAPGGALDAPRSVASAERPAESRVATRGAPRAHGEPMGRTKVFHDMGERVRGFAGFYFDEDGTVNVMLSTAPRIGLARREVSELLGRTHGRALGPHEDQAGEVRLP